MMTTHASSYTAARAEAVALSHPKYRPDIDGLRAVAILSVVIFHAFPAALPGGFIGVDVFFVISGFLISTIILESLRLDTFSFVEFYGRRARRIFPALAIVLAACAWFGWFALLPDEYKELGKHLASGAGFVSNFALWQESGYFDSAAETKPLLHLWSLGIEEQFYIFWPAILWCAHRCRLPKLPLTLLLLVASFAANIAAIQAQPIATFYSPLTRVWELLVGAVLAQLVLAGRVAQPAWYGKVASRASRTCATPIFGIALVLAGLVLLSSKNAFPGWWALLPAIGTALLILSAPGNWLNSRLLSSRVAVWIGLISFPLYLWHWPLLAFARVIEGDTPSAAVRSTAVVAAVVLASATYLLVERNVRRLSGMRMIGVAFAAVVAAIGLFGYSIFQSGGAPTRDNVLENAQVGKQLEGSSWQYTTNDICKDKYPANFRYFCTQNREGSPTMILLGDSFANALYAGIVANPYLRDQVVLSYGSCEPSGTALNPDIQANCQIQNQIIKSTPTIRYAILNAWWPRFDEAGRHVDFFTGKTELSPMTATKYLDGLQERVSMLEAQGIKVFLFGPKPEISYDIKYCFARPFKEPAKTCHVSPSEGEAQQRYLSTILQQVLSNHPNVTFFDQNGVVCRQGTCDLVATNGMPMLRDNGHYSRYGSSIAIDAFVAQAQREGYFTASAR